MLQYVTEFLQQAHIGRRALHGAGRHQHRALRHEAAERAELPRRMGGRSKRRSSRRSAKRPCGMSHESVPDAGSLRRGRFLYFPVAPGRLEFVDRTAARAARGEAASGRGGAAGDARRQLTCDAVARLPQMSVILYPEEGEDEDGVVYVPVEPADPFTEAVRTALEIGAEIVFAEPGLRPNGRTCPTCIPIRTRCGMPESGEVRRSLPRLPAAALRGDRRARRRHRLEAARHGPAGDACSWWCR